MTSKRFSGKIVIVSEHYAPDPSTTAIYITAIAEGLKTACEVLVISGTAHSASRVAAQPHVVEVKTWTPEKDALLRRAAAIVLCSLKMFFATLKHVTRDDVVLCVTTPFAVPYSVTLATKLRKGSAILLIHDLYPDALVMAGLLKPGSLMARAIRFANGLMFAALDAIITIGRDVEALLLSYQHIAKRKIKFVPNWALLPIGYREPSVENTFRRRFTGKFVIGLSGNLGFTHSAGTVYGAARLLQNEKDIHFMLSGAGSGWKQLKDLCAKAPLDNVTLTERVAGPDLEEFLSAADVWVIPYRRNVTGVSVPSRIYNLLAVGRPIIVTAEACSEAALILKEDNIGWVVRPEDALDLANAIRSAAADREETQAKGQRAALAAQRYTYDRAIASYRQILDEVMHAAR